MSGISSFSLSVEVRCGESSETAGDTDSLNEACSKSTSCDVFLVSSEAIKISPDPRVYLTEDYTGTCLVAIFVPKDYLTLSLADHHEEKPSSSPKQSSCSSIKWIDSSRSFMNNLVSRIHPFLSNVIFRGAIRQNGLDQAASDIVLIEAPSPSVRWVADMLDAVNGEGMAANDNAVIKVLPLSRVDFTKNGDGVNNVASLSVRVEIPPCPVCLHRIDPVRIGLPKPKNHHLCSKFCTCANQIGDQASDCTKQRFLSPLPPPSYCVACHVINDYWINASKMALQEVQDDSVAQATQLSTRKDDNVELFCNRCGMQETLWVCLSCGFVGCGRYSNVHAEEHYKESGHNFSLELVTLRIWDYDSGEFAHRGDLLECPSVIRTHSGLSNSGGAQSAFGRVGLRDSDSDDYKQQGGFESKSYQIPNLYLMSGDETSPKKANMIGEEYEALLQSALEDQAQHYEGEITRLRAALTAEQVDEDKVTAEEMKEIEALNSDVANYRAEIEALGRQLLDAQAQEAGYRASSQRLLREQAVATDLLEKISEEAARENEQGKMQVEELEQQIADLTANLRMRHQFSQDEELNNAQIFGTTSSNKKQSKRGKKSRRFWK